MASRGWGWGGGFFKVARLLGEKIRRGQNRPAHRGRVREARERLLQGRAGEEPSDLPNSLALLSSEGERSFRTVSLGKR